MAAEKNFENRIKKYIKARGGWYVKYWGSGMTEAGIPDLLCCIDGRFVGIEVKAQNGRPSELQLWTIDKIREAGGIAFVLYPSAWKRFTAWVESGMEDDLPVVLT